MPVLHPRRLALTLYRPSHAPHSLYAYGVLDEGYRWDLSVQEAIELGLRSIYHATFRDAASGGTVSGELMRLGSCSLFVSWLVSCASLTPLVLMLG